MLSLFLPWKHGGVNKFLRSSSMLFAIVKENLHCSSCINTTGILTTYISRVLSRFKPWLTVSYQVKLYIGLFSKTNNSQFTRHAIKRNLQAKLHLNLDFCQRKTFVVFQFSRSIPGFSNIFQNSASIYMRVKILQMSSRAEDILIENVFLTAQHQTDQLPGNIKCLFKLVISITHARKAKYTNNNEN